MAHVGKKVTASNHLPGKDDDRFPVHSKQFNALVDVVNGTDFTQGTVTQITSITTGVTLNTLAGLITTASLGIIPPDTSKTFTVTNSNVTAASIIMATVNDFGTGGVWGTNGIPIVTIDNVTAGAFDVVINNAGVNGTGGQTLLVAFNIVA